MDCFSESTNIERNPMNPFIELKRIHVTMDILLPLWVKYLERTTNLNKKGFDILFGHIGKPEPLLTSSNTKKVHNDHFRGGISFSENKSANGHIVHNGGFIEYGTYTAPQTMDGLIEKKWLFSTFLKAILDDTLDLVPVMRDVMVDLGKYCTVSKESIELKKQKRKASASKDEEEDDGEESEIDLDDVDVGEDENGMVTEPLKDCGGVSKFMKALKTLHIG